MSDQLVSPSAAIVREHVMSLAEDQIIDIHNPANLFAFWLSAQDLKQDLETLEESVLKDLKIRMGTHLDLDIDGFVEHCRGQDGGIRKSVRTIAAIR